MSLLLLLQSLVGGGDVTPPTVSSAEFVDDTVFVLTFDENISVGAGGSEGFTLTPTNGGAAVQIYFESISASNEISFYASRTVYAGETFTLAYTQPGAGIEDTSGNDLASFTGTAVTNSSAVAHIPTNISITNSNVAISAGLNAIVGAFSTTDPFQGDSFTYTLVVGTGDTDNASFNISGNYLRANNPALLADGTYSVRIRSTDSNSNTLESIFQVAVYTLSIGGSGIIRKRRRRRK